MSSFNPLDYPICLATPRRMVFSTWLTHVPTGMLLVALLRPRMLVELGTYLGASYCAFCQAVEEMKIDAQCFAVDTWEGDVHSEHYGPEVLRDLKAHHDPLYGQFSRLVQSTFTEAANHFEDGAIDFLHIDGLHTYEAVRQDFVTWLPKMSTRGVVLFHDVNVRERGFGVWQLWDELKRQYRHIDMHHGHGLGVLLVGEGAVPQLEPLLKEFDRDPVTVRQLLYGLGERIEALWEATELRQRTAQQQKDIEWFEDRLREYQRIEKNGLVRFLRAWILRGPEYALRRGVQVLGKAHGR